MVESTKTEEEKVKQNSPELTTIYKFMKVMEFILDNESRRFQNLIHKSEVLQIEGKEILENYEKLNV
jgi:hypothetical protein